MLGRKWSLQTLNMNGIEDPHDRVAHEATQDLQSRLGHVGVRPGGHTEPCTQMSAQRQGNTIRIVMPGEERSTVFVISPGRGSTFSALRERFQTAFPDVELQE